MTLKSKSELQPQQSKTMDFMDVDQVLEFPDTPDRLAAAHKSNCNSIDRRSNASMNNHLKHKGKSVTVNRKQRLLIHPDSCSGSPVSQSVKNTKPTNIDTSRHDKGKALCNSNAQKSTRHVGSSFADLAEKNGHGQSGISRVNASRKDVLSLNHSTEIDSLNKSSKSCQINNTMKAYPNFDRGKDVDFVAAAHHKAESSIQPCTSSKVSRQKMLVRNGCISPHNIAKSRNVVEKHDTGSMVKEVQSGSGTLASNGRSSVVDIKDLIAEAKDSRRFKGKGVFCHPSSEELDAGSGHLSHSKSVLKEPADSSCNFSVEASRCPAKTERRGTPHNHSKRRDLEQQKKRIMERNHRNEREFKHLNESEIISSPSAHKLGINSQKEDSRNCGKRSISCIDDSAGEPSTSRSKKNKSLRGVGPLNPVSEPNNNEDSSLRALQIEADEMLARELQEQLYDEQPTVAVEIDEGDSDRVLAMPMQQYDSGTSEDDSSWVTEHMNSYRRQRPSILNAREQIRSSTSHRPSLRRRLQPHSRTSTRSTLLRRSTNPHPRIISRTSNRRNSIFPPNIGVDLRMEILETLEAAGDMRMPSDLLQVGREFNEDDYEMLLALDDDNHRHGGATRTQISNLPESTVQAENNQECAICLETPTIGETIRHLPCLHRFHKACIDRWLRRKTSCPVCKSSVT